MGKTIVITNRKGGCGKSATCVNLGIGLVRKGKKVMCIDTDSQYSLSVSFGVKEPDKLPITITTLMSDIVNEKEIDCTNGILTHSEGIDFIPANNNLARMEIELVPLIGRETILRQYINKIKSLYDYILIDTAPTLGMLTVNALAAADSVIIPVTPKYLDAKGLELLLKTISQIKRQINPTLEIGGILLTMVNKRANFTKEIISLIENAYKDNIHIFNEHIPYSVRAAETSAYGKSIFQHDPKGKVAAAYAALAEEVFESA